jgi:site-specific DNA-cytosine methylase
MLAIELFPCSGGMAEGFRRAGIRFDMAFDKDPDACASYEANHGHRPIQMDARDLLRMAQAGWRPGPIDLLVADPPCTPYSRAGKRLKTEDERDMLGPTVELIRLLRPSRYLIGNVPGLDDMTSWHIVQRLIGGLGRDGYCVADYAQLDAADYGVPQRRIRPFWFGHIEGPCLRWPAPTHAAPNGTIAFAGLELQPWVTCRQALGHLSLAEMGRPVRLRRRAQHSLQHGSVPEKPARGVGTSNLSDGNVLIVSGKHPTATADGPSPTVRGGGDGHSAPSVILENERHACARLDRPSPAVTAKVRGQSAQVLALDESHGHPTSKADAPAWTITSQGGRPGKRSSVLEGLAERASDPNRPPTPPDEPHRTISVGGRDRELIEMPKERRQGMRTGTPDEPGATVTAKPSRVGAGAGQVLEWPWNRPSTTLQTDEGLPPPGHRDENWQTKDGGRARSTESAIVLSERAAAILQGFPEAWRFVGKSKRSRWSQLGQAMPPGLAEPVARAIVEQIEATAALGAKRGAG